MGCLVVSLFELEEIEQRAGDEEADARIVHGGIFRARRKVQREQADPRHHEADYPASHVGHRCPPLVRVAPQNFPDSATSRKPLYSRRRERPPAFGVEDRDRRSGNSTRKVVPPAPDSTRLSAPPCAATISRAITRPSPTP